MTSLETILLCTCIFELFLLGVSSFFLYRFGVTILAMQDAIEDSLDILDTRYTSISKILERPLFMDSPEIRKVQNDIHTARDAILQIANTLTQNGEFEEEEEDEA